MVAKIMTAASSRTEAAIAIRLFISRRSLFRPFLAKPAESRATGNRKSSPGSALDFFLRIR
jgi:hypothetical protein